MWLVPASLGWICPAAVVSRRTRALAISSGFSFQADDDSQLLVSVQKPMGMVLEQEDGPIVVASVDPDGSAAQAGVQAGHVLLAVQNANVEEQALEDVLEFIGQAPRIVNLRFQLPEE